MLAGPMERNRKFASSGFDERLIITVSRRFTLLWAEDEAAGTWDETAAAVKTARARMERRKA